MDKALQDIRARLDGRDPQKPFCIMVAGGSATGKSSAVLPEVMAAFGDQAVLVEQDWYQLGQNFAEKDTSPYRWDDPRNFQIDRMATDLRALKRGEPITTPSFDVVAVGSVGERTITSHPVIVVDGIYTLHGELKELSDYGIYMSMPLYGRFLRRLFRMIYDQKQDKPQTAFKQVFGSVLKAHLDFVRRQAEAAQYTISLPYSFADTIDRYGLQPHGVLPPAAAAQVFSHDDLAFYVHQENPDAFRFSIVYQDKPYYDFLVDNTYRALLDDIDYLGL